eukprot:4619654-Amphidinium_carterae.1
MIVSDDAFPSRIHCQPIHAQTGPFGARPPSRGIHQVVSRGQPLVMEGTRGTGVFSLYKIIPMGSMIDSRIQAGVPTRSQSEAGQMLHPACFQHAVCDEGCKDNCNS